MITVFNLLIIALVGLIGYWWANQGVFSGILHLLCVVVAGAIAFAFWEPVTVGLLLRGSGFDNYAWGVSLLVLFVVPLFLLRLATNKLVPANIDLPHWANLTFGFPIGVASGILTMGIVLLGTGFVQSQRDLFGYTGVVRNPNNATQITLVGNGLWFPVHKFTSDFYGWLSVTSLSTGQPLRQYYPDLYKVSGSQFRDTFRQGLGQVSISPNDATIKGVTICPEQNRCGVRVEFAAGARDFGEQLTISSAQLRLVSAASGRNRPLVAHPQGWSQPTRSGGTGKYLFDDISNYATTVPGQETATMAFDFPWPNADTRTPAFIQIKGLRFDLPQPEALTGADYARWLSSSGPARTSVSTSIDRASVGQLTATQLQVSNSLRPVNASKNMLPGTIRVDSQRFITEGFGGFRKDGVRAARLLRIQGFAEPEGTRIVQLTVRRGGIGDLFNPALRQKAGDDAAPVLVDSRGRTYSPIGYIYDRGEIIDVSFSPRKRITNVADLPQLSQSGGRALRIIFNITEGVQLVELRLGDIPVARCNLSVVRPGSGGG